MKFLLQQVLGYDKIHLLEQIQMVFHCEITRRRFTLDQSNIFALLKKQAMLDIIVTPEQESWMRLVTYYYDAAKSCHVFKITNGSGDHLYALFSKQGAVIKGFDHASCRHSYEQENKPMEAKIYHNIPVQLFQLLEKDIEKNDVTFCLWQLPGEAIWHKNQILPPPGCSQEEEDGGESFLMKYIFASAEEWYAWASIYYELEEEAWDAAERLYETGEITRSMVNDLNPDRDYDTIVDECKVCGLLEA